MNDKIAIVTVASPAAQLLLPAQLAEQAADAVRELLAEATAANTTRSYATALRYWAGWYKLRFGTEFALPVSEAAAIQFLVDHILRRGKSGCPRRLKIDPLCRFKSDPGPSVDRGCVDALRV